MGHTETSSRALAREAVGRLRAEGAQAYLVGGCVRDLLLGREPKDFDVATDAPPERILGLFPDAKPVGARFGVVLLRRGEAQVEIATFRSDEAYSDGRRPDKVRFEADPRMDALRRDFTINALLMDPFTGEILDFTGGRQDLEARRIRVIGDPEARFGEDQLRLLRAVRLAGVLGFEIEPETFAAIRRLAARIRSVSAERIREELVRLLTEGNARRGVELLDESRLLVEILPEVHALQGVPQPPEYHPEGDVWVHTLLMLGLMNSKPSPTLALGVLLHDIGKPPTYRVAERIRFDGHDEVGARMAVEILSRLRFSNQEIRRVELLVKDHLRFKDVPQMRPSTLKRFVRQPHFEELLELHRLDCLASHRRLDTHNFLMEMLRQTPPERLAPPPLLRGGDLIALGYKPGPLFGRILAAVEEQQLEGRLETREQALQFVLAEFGAPSPSPGQAGR